MSITVATKKKPKSMDAFDKRPNPQPNAKFALTPRESQVAKMIAHSLTNEAIGHHLGISVETVKEHVANILKKSGFSSRTQIAVWMTNNW